ncbi:MAG: subclass B1 metallo-beta-lactamase [Chthoniobacteraceae bacterium]
MNTARPLCASLALLFLEPALFATQIVAHRGASHDAPENTVSAFKVAWEQAADAIELDIYLTKDGRIAVLHDPTTKRTAGVDRKIEDQTLEELRTLDAGVWKGAHWKGERIPTLEEVLATLPAGRQIFIEIKCGAKVLPELERVLTKSGKQPEQLVIIAFDYDTVKLAKERFPRVTVYWLAAPKKESRGLVPSVEELIVKAKAGGLNGLDLSKDFAIDAAFVSRVKAADLKLHVWTVDDAATALQLAAMGVDGIGTNRPGWMREQIAKTDAASNTVRFAQLSPTVWMHTSMKEVPGFGLVPANGLIVIEGDHSVLVDTAWNDDQTAQILDWATDTLKKPIQSAVFTHAHADKMGGVGIVRKRGIETYALPLSNTLAVKRGLSPAEHELDLRENGPSQTFGPLAIFYPGAGHTTDNIVVNIETAGILFGGCLIRPGGTDNLGNTADGDIAHWDKAVAAVAARFPDSQIVVPSHGAPAGRELFDLTISLARAASKGK